MPPQTKGYTPKTPKNAIINFLDPGNPLIFALQFLVLEDFTTKAKKFHKLQMTIPFEKLTNFESRTHL